MKTCSKCGRRKPLDEFYKMGGMRDGHRNDCKACNLAAKAARHQANPTPARERAKAWNRDHPEQVRARRAQYIAEGRKQASDRRSHLKRKYGITPERYEEMLAAQGGGCAICGRPPRSDIALHVDHDHATGKVRGLTCFRHNNALGDFNDDPVLLEKAAAYLRSHDPTVQEEVALVKARVRALVPPEPTLF